MKLILNKNTLEKIETKEDEEQKSGSINDYEVEIEFDESWDNLYKTLIIVKSENKQIEDTGTHIAILTNKVCIDREKKGQYWLGLVGYTLQFVQNQDEEIKEEEKYYIRTGTEENYNYVFVENPIQEDLPTYFKAIKNYQRSTNLVPKYFGLGAGEIKAENVKVPTPTEWEIYNAQIQEFIKQGQTVVDEAENLINDIETKLANGEFNGKDYTITEEDYKEIGNNVKKDIQPILDQNLQQAKDYADSTKPTKTSELTNDSNFAKTDSNNNFATSQTINGTLTINGDIVQNGEEYETHAEKLYTKKNEIILREKAIGGMSKDEFAGLIALLYNGIVSGRLGFKADGTAYVGDVGDEQPLLTRDETVNLADGQLLKWDAEQLKAVGINIADAVGSVKASETQFGAIRVWASQNENSEIGLNISTEV